MTEQHSKPRERIFHTNGGETPAAVEGLVLAGGQVRDLTARVKKIATIDEGKLQILLEGEVHLQAELEKIRDLFLIQQGRVLVDFTPEQGELEL